MTRKFLGFAMAAAMGVQAYNQYRIWNRILKMNDEEVLGFIDQQTGKMLKVTEKFLDLADRVAPIPNYTRN